MTNYRNIYRMGVGLFFKDCEPTDKLNYDPNTGELTIGTQGDVFPPAVAKRIIDDWNQFNVEHEWNVSVHRWMPK